MRVFPVLLAPDRAQLLNGYSLASALRDFVREDPEVFFLGRKAVKLAPEFAAVFIQGRCTVHGVAEWPVDADRWSTIGHVHPDPEKRRYSSKVPDPVEVAVAAEALLNRYKALISILRKGELVAVGIAQPNGQIDCLPGSTWGHEDFHLNMQGDVFQTNDQCQDPYFDRLVRRWAAVELRVPNAKTTLSPFHVEPVSFDDERSSNTDCDVSPSAFRKSKRRKTPKKLLVAEALAAEGIQERGDRTLKEIVSKIRPHLLHLKSSNEAIAKAVERLLPN